MKLTKSSRTVGFVVLSLAAIVYFHSSITTPCSSVEQVNCVVNQQSWLNWLSGNSRSTQYHFVDFLELVNQLIPNKLSNN